jgi:hypothetical protein
MEVKIIKKINWNKKKQNGGENQDKPKHKFSIAKSI